MQAKQIQYLRLSNYIPGKNEHEAKVSKFNDIYGHNLVLLLDSKAASSGLNLTVANKLLIIDQEWDANIDKKIVSTIWRIGQRREVIVYRLFLQGSIEEQIVKRHFTLKKTHA